jgi:hypothetical protein
MPELAVLPEVWAEYARNHSVRELGGLIEKAIKAHRRKTELTEEDLFEDKKKSTGVPKDSGPAKDKGHHLVAAEEASVSTFVATLENWIPSSSSPAESYWDALAKIDRAVARAKLRLLRDVLVKQQKATRRYSLDLKAAIRVLVGDDQITNTKPGDTVYQIFKAAGIEQRPDDPILAAVWDKRRVAHKESRLLKKRSG